MFYGSISTYSETITYTSTTKTTSKTWNIRDNAGNPRTCTKNNVEVYMDNTDPMCTHSISGENSPGDYVTISFTCNETDGEIDSIVTPHFINGGFGDQPVGPYNGGTYTNPFTISRQYNEGAYGYICRNKAGGTCTYAPEVEVSTCNKCPEDCCNPGWYLEGGECCTKNGGLGGVRACDSPKTCYTAKCTSAKYCGYHVK